MTARFRARPPFARRRPGAGMAVAWVVALFGLAPAPSNAGGSEGGPASMADRGARGLVRSRAEATISSEIAARITAMPFREGESFAEGELLVAFDCAGLQAAAAGAEADLRAARVTLETSREMLRMKATGQREVDLGEARRDKAAADVEAIQARLKACSIRAPFSGSVVERSANPHEVIAPSTPLLRIVDGERLDIELIVESAWLGGLAPGTPITFRVDDTSRSYPARMVRLGAVVDPASQTAKAFATFEGPHPGVLQGMSGTAVPARDEASR